MIRTDWREPPLKRLKRRYDLASDTDDYTQLNDGYETAPEGPMYIYWRGCLMICSSINTTPRMAVMQL